MNKRKSKKAKAKQHIKDLKAQMFKIMEADFERQTSKAWKAMLQRFES